MFVSDCETMGNVPSVPGFPQTTQSQTMTSLGNGNWVVTTTTTTTTVVTDSSNTVVSATNTTTVTQHTEASVGPPSPETLVSKTTSNLAHNDPTLVKMQEASKRWWNRNAGDDITVAGLVIAGVGAAATQGGSPAGVPLMGVGGAVAGTGKAASYLGVTWQNIAAWGSMMNPCDGDFCVPMP
jgi:hypothetical protein